MLKCETCIYLDPEYELADWKGCLYPLPFWATEMIHVFDADCKVYRERIKITKVKFYRISHRGKKTIEEVVDIDNDYFLNCTDAEKEELIEGELEAWCSQFEFEDWDYYSDTYGYTIIGESFR